ncbi:hypothetical protein GCK32_022854 [Trichostrongylus colubriformis]|uniref:Phlebovirus glycoprotein G2 fusion domain-containing protein n=1 Tax=Trichostrongylus colubriformis TaxID=6319 RepID=A0AAN8F0Y4_TRICO
MRAVLLKCKKITGKTQSYQVERPSYQLKRRKKKIHGIIATIACIMSTAQCCSNIVTLQGETTYCTMEKNEEKCTYDQVTQLLLQPIGQEACLILRNKEKRVMGTIAIRLEQISHICKQKTEYFTRDHQFLTESRRQCYKTESCQGNTCSSLKPEMKLVDFSTISNSNPGYTYCVPSCGCFWCNWCFYCTSTCLFYRNYAIPTSSTIYRVFTCPTWSIQAEGIATIRSEDYTSTQRFTLQPGIPFTWNKVQLTLTSTITPSYPILSSYFLTDSNITTRIEPSPQGQLLLNSPGQVQCKTEEDAKTFRNCLFSKSACSCNPRKYKVVCTCSNGTISSFLQNKHNKLPIITTNVAIINEGSNVKAKTTIGSALAVQISANGLVIAANNNNNSCQVQMEELTGCYDCTQGAKTNVSCTSSISEETAQIECSNNTQLVRCTPEGRISTIRFHFSSSTVVENCTIRCPGGISTATLTGRLAFVNEGTYLTEIIPPTLTESSKDYST